MTRSQGCARPRVCEANIGAKRAELVFRKGTQLLLVDLTRSTVWWPGPARPGPARHGTARRAHEDRFGTTTKTTIQSS